MFKTSSSTLPTLEFCIEESSQVSESDLESLYAHGQRLFNQGDLEACEAVQQQLLTTVKENYADDALLESTMLDCLVLTTLAQNNFKAAETYALRALSIYQAAGQSESAAKTLNSLALILTQLGRDTEADACFSYAISSMETWSLSTHNTVDHVQIVPILQNAAAFFRARFGDDHATAQDMTSRIERIIAAATKHTGN